MNNSYRIVGRIRTEDSNAGIHGLCVEIWQRNDCDTHFLGSDLTNSDGSYSMCFDRSALKDAEESCPDVFLIVKDCECRVLYDSRDKPCACAEGVPQEIDVTLPPDVLWWHRKCSSWSCPDGPLLPEKTIDEIEEAMELLAGLRLPPNSSVDAVAKPQHAYRVNPAVKCLAEAKPLIACFDNIVNDAWRTLEGDLEAARRYRDILDVVCADQSPTCCNCSPGEYARLVDELFDEYWRPNTPVPACCEQSEEDDECSLTTDCPPDPECPPDSEPPCPCRPANVDSDKLIVLLMAALHISCGHAATAKRYMLTLLEQVCRFQLIGALHRAAVRAGCGDDLALQQFRDMLEALVKRCDVGFCCCEICIDEGLAACIRDMLHVWSSMSCYRVTAVEPPRACPGDRLSICGEGFGRKAGRIVFRQKGSLDLGPSVKPDKWCATSIELTVPESAGCGLYLRLPKDTVKVCDRFLEYRPAGCMDAGFEGTSAEILRFAVKGRTDEQCLRPGEPLRIRWKTCAADSVVVEILNRKTGSVIAKQDPADARGCWDFLETNFTSTTEVTVRITARGKCQPAEVSREIDFVFQNPPKLSVHGIEVTQAIQHYRASEHLTDPADRGPDNSLRLVTNKSAWVRVYLRSGQIPGFDGGDLKDVDGTLTLERRVGGVWSQVAQIASQNGPVDARDSFVNYDAERGNINESLNFIVPAAQVTGLLRLRVDVASPYKHCPGNTATGETSVDVNLTQTLNAAFITIGYNGPNNTNTGNLNLPAPTLAQCQAETSWAMTTYPVSGAPNVRVAGTFVTNTPLNDPRSCPGCCSPNWGPLLTAIGGLVAADQAAFPGGNWVYYGIISSGIPVTVPGCSGSATGGLAGAPVTYAHEIGHQFGLPHARCGNAGTGNPAYPVYEPYDLPVDVPANPVSSTNWTMASIGEYGLDINNGNIANPNAFEDFMSYCGPRWIGRYTHNYLINRPTLVPQVIPTGSGAASDRVVADDDPGFARDAAALLPLIDIMGQVDDGKFEVSSVARLETRFLAGAGRVTDYTAQLIQDGKVIASEAVYAFSTEGMTQQDKGCCDECKADRPFLFRAMLDDRALGDSICIVDKHGESVFERSRPSEAPSLSHVSASVDEKNCTVKVAWRLKCASKTGRDVWIRWSDDDGETWRALAVGVSGSSATFDFDSLPSGDVVFQVMAHDGFSSVTGQTKAVSLPARAPAVTILYPTSSSKVYGERQIHLSGVASSAAGAEIADDAYLWYVGEELVGRGRDIWIDNPGRGKCVLRLDVTENDLTGSASNEIQVL